MTPLAPRVAEWVALLRYEDIPAEVIASAKDRILDIIGICVAAQQAEASIAVRRLRDESGPGSPQAGFVGDARKGAATIVAMVNGTYAHALDFDDTHLPSVVHPSAPMIPALLAEAEAMGASGSAFLTALVAAYEVNTRLAMAQYDAELGNSVFFERGLHATSIIGAVAAAAGAARLRGCGSGEIANAIAIACSLGAGLIEANRAGGSIKQFHGGWAAHAAVTAAEMAAHGLTGPATILEGRFGFFQAYCSDRWNPEAITDSLGVHWNTPSIFFKPYPCNHFTHAFVDAALAFKNRGLTAADVDSVTLGTAGPAWRTIGDPIEEKRHPLTPYHAAFSAPFVFATALVGGSGLGVSTQDFTAATLSDPNVLRIAERTEVVVDTECTRIFPKQFPGVATVRTKDGRLLEERILVNRGGPERPLSREELLKKLSDNAGPLADGIALASHNLTTTSTVGTLIAATRSR
jgi:2-methylcitrate dehydratase PrpD